jgi:hypothetical protein
MAYFASLPGGLCKHCSCTLHCSLRPPVLLYKVLKLAFSDEIAVVFLTVESAPSEGTDEECHVFDTEAGTAASSVGHSGKVSAEDTRTQLRETSAQDTQLSKGGAAGSSLRFVKDSFTGQLRRMETSELSPTHAGKLAYDTFQSSEAASNKSLFSKGRTLGPKICGCCLADRRLYVKSHLTDANLPPAGLVSLFLPPVPNSSTAASNTNASATAASSTAGASAKRSGGRNSGPGGAAGQIQSGEVIAIATHCEVCNACVIDQDHHSIFLW